MTTMGTGVGASVVSNWVTCRVGDDEVLQAWSSIGRTGAES